MSTALLVVDHGSRKTESNQRLGEVAEALRILAPDCLVASSHMEIAEPSIATAVESLVTDGATHIHVLPYFLGAGRHISQDIPQLVADAVAPHSKPTSTLTYDIGEALGPDISLAQLLLQRSPNSDSTNDKEST